VAPMEFRILGPLEVTDGDGPRPLGGPKQRTVLAHLVLRANQIVDSDRLIDEVWGDEPPPAVRSTLRGYVSHLRKALGPGLVEHSSGGYVLRAERSAIDAVRFEALVAEGRGVMSADAAAAARTFERALGLWRGPALGDLAHQASLQPEIARLEELRLAALEDRIAAELELGRHRELVPELETLVGAHPFRERLWLHLMTALYRSERQADALAAFHRARDLLAEELGIDPSPELRRLHERILRQDPSLDVAGEPLRGYRLLDQVGAGSFGSVHRAFQPQVGREVAIKTIHSRFANDPEFIRRFEAEAQLVARLEHPHVVPLYDFWREPEGAYLVMRYLRGGSLRERLAQGPLGAQEAARLLDQVALALGAAHRQGVVHRDVKPANILFDEEGNAYLSDFGIAKDVEVAEVAAPGGTPSPLAYYLTPEEVRGEPATPRTDIYSLGVVLYEMLAGRHPFADAPPEEVVDKHLSGPVPSIGAFRPDLPASVDEVIGVATAKAPADRYSDAQMMASAFRGALLPTASRPAMPSTEVRNPYKGLRPFQESDAADFFGREALVAELVARLSEQGDESRFLAVVGPSGSGKSSLVRAGLLPALRGGAVPGSERWFLLDMRPGTHPFEELASALMRIAVDPPGDLVERLERDDRGLVSAAEEVVPPGSVLLLVVDQFEELFTLVDAEDVRARFLRVLLAAATDPTSRLRILLTLRADFYDRPLGYAGLAELMKSRAVTVTPLAPEELHGAVVGPAQGVGLQVDPALVADIVADVAAQPGALPLLQYALTELFDHREGSTLTLEAYREIGGVSGALSRRAETLYRRLNRSGRDAARQVFLRLLTVGNEGADDTRRRVLRSELISLEGEIEAREAVIETFGTRRLLSFDRDPVTRGPTVEVAHEALLREWDRLRGWIEAAREDVRTQGRLAVAAHEWVDADRDPSFLATGSRLGSLEAWQQGTGLAMTPREREFLEASLAGRDRLRAEEEAREARERELERRSLRRLRAVVAVVTAAALFAAALTALAFGQRGRAEREERIAVARELAAAAVANLDVDPERSILLALEAVDRTRSSDGSVLPEAEEALHRAVVASRIVLSVPGIGGWLDWSPDGTRFVTEGPKGTGVVDIRNAETGESMLSFTGHDGDVNGVAFSGDGSMLATTGDDGTAKVWDPESGRRLGSVQGLEGLVTGPSFSPDGSLAAAAWHLEGTVRVWDVATSRIVHQVDAVSEASRTAFSPDGKRLAIAGDAEVGVVVDVRSGKEVLWLEGHEDNLEDVDWSPDGRWIATSSPDATVGIWDGRTGDLRFSLFHDGPVGAVDWSPDGGRLVTGSSDGRATVWEVTEAGGKRLFSLSARDTSTGVHGVAFSPDGNRVLTGDAAITAAKVWDVSHTGDAEWTNVPGDPGWVTMVAFSPSGRELVASGEGGAVAVWDPETGENIKTLQAHRSSPEPTFVVDLDVSPDGALIATMGQPNHPSVWDRTTGQEVFTFQLGGIAENLDWSPDGRLLAIASISEERAFILDRSGQEVADLPDTVGVLDVQFSPDGRLLATASEPTGRPNPPSEQVKIWDWESGQTLTEIPVAAQGMAFDPSGRRIAIADGSLAGIWDVDSGRKLRTFAGHEGGLWDVAFSPDGSRLATAGADNTVRLWDVDTGVQRLVLRGHKLIVDRLAFSPDGSKLASGAMDGTARVWALDLDDLIQIARRELTRELTEAECRQYVHGPCPT
jgi:WD40 repeat protein/serine/threonine protein kinase